MTAKLQYALGCIAIPGEFHSKYAFAASNSNSLLKSLAILDSFDLNKRKESNNALNENTRGITC